MESSKARKHAKAFVREFSFQNPTLSALKGIITKQGYTLIEYNHIYNSEEVAALLIALKLDEYANRTKGFTYADNNYRLVFLHEDLSENEKLLILAHEEGHIYCGHLSTVPIIGRDVIDEHEANEFSHYILKQHAFSKIKAQLIRRWKPIVACVLAMVLILSGLMFFTAQKHKRDYYSNFYITSTGSKYHRENCIFVKGKATVHRMTTEEYESGAYEPCAVCLSGEN